MLSAAHQREVEARPQQGLEVEGGAAAVEAAAGDDGHAVAQQVGLVHVVRGQDDCAPWGGEERGWEGSRGEGWRVMMRHYQDEEKGISHALPWRYKETLP